MTRAARIFYSVALAVGLMFGTVFGFWDSAERLRVADGTTLVALSPTLGDFSFVQYKYANPEQAKASLKTSIQVLEKMERFHPGRGQEFELASAYTRLALLTEPGDVAQSQAFMANARHWNLTAGGQDLSDEQMKAGLQAFDSFRSRSRQLPETRLSETGPRP
jgi:hypothetical protein